MKRHKANLSNYKLTSGYMGELLPVGWTEVLPGDTFQQSSAVLLRVTPMVAPVMHPCEIRLHHFFVPNRLLWTSWENFITGGPDGLDASVHPTITSTTTAGNLEDYLGLPRVAGHAVNALPFRAYNLIYNEYYKDQDLQTSRANSLASGVDATTDVTLASVCWEKDYFTSARVTAQKGATVTVPLGTSALVRTSAADQVTGAQNGMRIRRSDTGGTLAANQTLASGSVPPIVGYGNTNPGADQTSWYPSNLYADLTAATAQDIRQIRRAFALMKYKEARARFGSRYTEYLAYLGVHAQDNRLQRPEYLGGGKQTISFSEVLQTATGGGGVGEMFGHGIAALRTRPFRRFFPEHGILMSLLSVRPKSIYNDGIARKWNRTVKEDYFQKELQFIGMQEVLNKEVYAAAATPDGTFGYQERYREYREEPSQVTAEFRGSTLNDWHFARIFGAEPTLNSAFVTCTPGVRPFVDQTGADKLWMMVSHRTVARRMVAPAAVGSVL